MSTPKQADPKRCDDFLRALTAGLPHGYALTAAGLKWRDFSLELARSADMTLRYARAVVAQRAAIRRRQRAARK